MRRSRASLILMTATVAALLCAGPSQAEAWIAYRNARFGTTADLPKGWTMGEAPENDDGRVFTSPDRQAEIAVYGGYRAFQKDQEFADRLAPGEGESVTYAKKGKDWVVVSGTKGDRIFYRRSLLSCRGEIWNNVSIEYPASQKKKFDALVTRVSRSLRAGRSDGLVTGCS
ncbi:hypothetical protein [Methylosinus sp. C49]|uniref:hypothetical protein n=1 Tax=Methylosinus sp. C49 TaxID=2699395 RepID=UPI001FCE3422|nr:hypothetical protein [Methylosinus sp. C49]